MYIQCYILIYSSQSYAYVYTFKHDVINPLTHSYFLHLLFLKIFIGKITLLEKKTLANSQLVNVCFFSYFEWSVKD